jgi:hypothetical protein
LIVNVIRRFALDDFVKGFNDTRFVALARDPFIVVWKQEIEEDVPELRRSSEFISMRLGQIVENRPGAQVIM